MQAYYTILYVPNHKDLPASLLAIVVDNPEEWVNKWLERRDQFEMQKKEDKLVWTGVNKLSSWGNTPTMEGKPYADNQSEAPFAIYANKHTKSLDLGRGLNVEKNTDAFHYL